ncbi:MAG TPA: alpha/beta fold hydrolase [Asticcacaulis sp.]|nr:alpha/beta fold hydrolase [Asticcacaulis sp.]
MSKCLTALAVVLFLAAPAAMAQTNTTEIVVKGAIRPKPAAEIPPPPLEVFTQSPRVEQIAVSDDGSRFAFVTRKGGQRLLTTYNVIDGSNQAIKLSEDSISAITWFGNDHILLSATETAIRGTCPAALLHTFKAAQAVDDYIAAMTVGGFQGGGSDGKGISPDPILAMIVRDILSPPACADYGVRSHDAGTLVDLRTKQSISLGDKMGGNYYNHMALGLPKPVMVDGKLQLVGPFLELRDKSTADQVAQRVYLWRVDPDTGRGRIIDDHGGDLDRMSRYVDDWLVDASGQPIARAAYSYLDETFRIETQKDGKWTAILTRKIDAKAHTVAPFLAGLGRDGQSLLILDAVAGTDGQRRFHYYELSADGKLSEALDTGDATRDKPVFHPETGALAGFAHDGEITTYTFFDPELAEVYKHAVDTAPGQSVRVVAMARDPGQMILFAQGGDDPGSWHYYDFNTGKRVDIGSQYPSVPTEWVASQRPVRYKAADGVEIRALMTLPPQGEPKHRALVVLPHDGPLGHDGRSFDWLAQALASRGYVVLQPNYRGSDGYGAALTEAGQGQWSGRSLSDMADGVRYLAGQGIIDPKRVCIAGEGYGGYAALAGAQSGSPYRCAVSINGIADPGDYLKTAKQNAIADDIAALKADPQAPRAFRADANSPAGVQRAFGSQTPASITAAGVAVPVLLVHGQYDKTIPAGQSRSLRDDLQKAGKAVTYTELPDCSHDLATEACRLGTAQATVDFLMANNPSK